MMMPRYVFELEVKQADTFAQTLEPLLGGMVEPQEHQGVPVWDLSEGGIPVTACVAASLCVYALMRDTRQHSRIDRDHDIADHLDCNARERA